MADAMDVDDVGIDGDAWHHDADDDDDDDAVAQARALEEEEDESTRAFTAPTAVGIEYAIFRKLVKDEGTGETRWEPCVGTDEGHVPDSRVHQYHRIVGCKPSAADQAEIDGTPAVVASWAASRQATWKHLSHLGLTLPRCVWSHCVGVGANGARCQGVAPHMVEKLGVSECEYNTRCVRV